MNDPVLRKQRARTLENEIQLLLAKRDQGALALAEIRDDELYKEDGFTSFKEYCQERFDLPLAEANQMIQQAQAHAKIVQGWAMLEMPTARPGD